MGCVSFVLRRVFSPDSPTICDPVEYVFVFVLDARLRFDGDGLYTARLHPGGFYDNVVYQNKNKKRSFIVFVPNQVIGVTKP